MSFSALAVSDESGSADQDDEIQLHSDMLLQFV